ncbi:MAG: Lrp/AsnC family transcriptional regulator [Bifidobacterium crudilactis]|nr:Lrp/AsnC family transcriptional regulator [Bifidobacterium crudilactis]
MDDSRNAAAKQRELDAADHQILNALVADGQSTLSQLSQSIGLSVSAVQSRIQKMERLGVIKQYRAIVDYEKGGLGIAAYIAVTPLDYSEEDSIPTKLRGIDGIVSCYSVAGSPSFMLFVRVSSPRALENLLTLIHQTVPVATQTTIVLQPYFEGEEPEIGNAARV